MQNGRVRIKSAGDARGEAIIFNGEQRRLAPQLFGHEPNEVARTHGRLKHGAAIEAKPGSSTPHRLHHRLRCVMRRRGGIARGLQFGRRQESFKSGGAGFPALGDAFSFGGASDAEGVLQAAPTDIARKDALLFGRSPPVLGFEFLKNADRGEVVFVFLGLVALAKP